MVVHRGDIWWASLPTPVGSEPGYRRPVLIVQSDDFNRSGIGTVIAVAITRNLKLADAPGNVLLPRTKTALSEDSVANASQVITVDKRFLTECLGALPLRLFERVEEGIRLVLGL